MAKNEPRGSILDRIRKSVHLAPYTTWNIGGPAELFAEPRSVAELEELVDYARAIGSPVTLLGRGSNVLIDDAGIAGLVVCTRMLHTAPEFGPETIRVAAGHPMPRVAVTAAKHGRGGLEFLIGIPGTIGAGVAINAGLGGVGGTAMDSVLIEAKLLEPSSGEVRIAAANELELAYRHSNIPSRGLWVIEALLQATPADDPEVPLRLQREILGKRKAKQPLQKHTSGSVFKQPIGGKPAGWYIDQAGLKGLRVGGASVSTVHANWIENDGTATAKDVRELIGKVIATTENVQGIALRREVIFLGAGPETL